MVDLLDLVGAVAGGSRGIQRDRDHDLRNSAFANPLNDVFFYAL